jgi:hypothetical protein
MVGQRTKKILFIGIRNKYCCICHRFLKLDLESKDHFCIKNWNAPSTAMEADIIVDGIKNSLDMHNLIYNRMIGKPSALFLNNYVYYIVYIFCV